MAVLESEGLILELNEKDRICGTCEKPMKNLGKKLLYEYIKFIPAKMVKVSVFQSSYYCTTPSPNTSNATTMANHSIASIIFWMNLLKWSPYPTCTSNCPCHVLETRWILYLLDFNQLEAKYKKVAPTIKNNATNLIYLLTTDFKTAKVIEDKLGKRTSVTQSVSAKAGQKDTNITRNLDAQSLLSLNELLEMPFEEGVVI